MTESAPSPRTSVTGPGENPLVDPPDPQQSTDESEKLRAEIERLRAEIVQLRRQNGDLLKTIVDRDYERPPHYR